MMRLADLLLKAALMFLMVTGVYSCANKLSPTGGEKDVQAPGITKISPANFSKNLSESKIQITFDEFVALKDLKKQLIISPIMSPEPEIYLKRKTVIIELPDSLADNTTYTINFGNSIVDITESNPLENFQYVFSTGDYIDSLIIGGKAMSASTLKSEKGILIMLYENLQDSIPAKQVPDYFGKTNDNGIFVINNLKAGKYRLIALKDNNNNFLYDLPGEYIGFLNDYVTLPDSLPKRLFMSKAIPTDLRLKKAQSNGFNKVRMVFNRPSENISLKKLGGSEFENLITEFNKYNDTLQLFVTDTLTDSLAIVIAENSQVIDTARIVLQRGGKKSRGRGATLKGFTLSSNIKGSRLAYNQSVQLQSGYPLSITDKSRIMLFRDSLEVVDFELSIDSATNRKFKIKSDFKEGVKYKLQILPDALENIVHQKNDSLEYSFKVRQIREYGNLNIEFKPSTDAGRFVILLVDADDKTKRRQIAGKSGNYTFNYVDPGVYRIKVFFDMNKNGLLDPGDYWSGVQPERAFYYPEDVKIRSNWDVSVSWELGLN